MSDQRLLSFSRALSDSVKSGLPMADSLRKLSTVSWRERKLAAAADSVSQGKTLHESLATQRLFPPILIALIRAGEESGKLDAFLDRYCASLETKIDFTRRLNRALVYPAFTAGLAGVIGLAFATKALPMLLQPIVDAGGVLPEGAVKMMAAGDWIVENGLMIAGGFLAFAAAAWTAAGSGPGRKIRALAGHWLPGARYATSEARIYQFEATLELLLGAGLRPRQIMEILIEYFRDDPLTRRRLARGAVFLAEGKGFFESLGPALPEEDRTRFAVAERAGRLDETLGKLAVEHRERHMHRLKMTASAIQLGSIVALAPVCFGLAMWILWPTFAMLRQAGSMPQAAEGTPGGSRSFEMPTMQTSSKVTEESKAASRFNEAHAGGIAGFMQDHAVEGSEHGTASASEENGGEKSKKKKLKAPKLKNRQINRLAPMKIQSTTIRSNLD